MAQRPDTGAAADLPSPGRQASLDVFRGATVALMILVNNPGSWQALYPPLAHAPWHGLTPTDWVFPFFLFAVGQSLALALPRWQAEGRARLWRRIALRTAAIFALGLLLNAAPFVRWDATGELVLRELDTLRTMGVLQRIALCFGAAAALLVLAGRHASPVALVAAAVLLLGYWWACVALGAPGDAYSLQGWFGTALDRTLLGEAHLYRGEGVPFDPEGLASTPPAIAQVLLGWWVGTQLRGRALDAHAVARLCLWATLLLVLAGLWQWQMPLNKKIWTSSYVLHTSALAMLVLALVIAWLEPAARGLLRPATSDTATAAATAAHKAPGPGLAVRVLQAFGRNPLLLFVLSGLVPRALGLLRWPEGMAADGTPLWTTPLRWAYQSGFAGIGSDPRLGSLLYAIAYTSLYAALALWLDRRRLYLRV